MGKWSKLLLLLFVFLLTACTENVAIINGIDERDANEIVVFLASKGIRAEKVAAPSAGGIAGGGGAQLWNIHVPSNMITESMAILNRNGLPRKQGQTLLQLFGDTGLVPTDLQQKIRFQAGLAQQIANTIRQIDGVIDANVQLSVPPEDSGQPITTSVYVKHQGVLDNPSSQLVTKIKQLVAGSVAGLKLENVTVISDRSRFTDITLVGEAQLPEEEHEFVNIWGVTVVKSSVSTFRTIFILFAILVVLLFALIGWMIWRVLPLLADKGGLAYFLPLTFKAASPAVQEKAEEPPAPT